MLRAIFSMLLAMTLSFPSVSDAKYNSSGYKGGSSYKGSSYRQRSSSSGTSLVGAALMGAAAGAVVTSVMSNNDAPTPPTPPKEELPSITYNASTNSYVRVAKCKMDIPMYMCDDPVRWAGYIVKVKPGEKYRLIDLTVFPAGNLPYYHGAVMIRYQAVKQ